MKIYHTETQEAYDALMVELEAQGCEWLSGDRMTELSKNWKRHSSKTCVSVDKKVVMFDKKSYYTSKYPEVPIQKYKAKVGEKMRFTKENVEKVIDEYFWQADLEPCGDLIAEIYNLDDTPEKVVVPKFVADYLEDCKKRNIKLVSALCPFKMGYGKEIELWFDNEDNNRLFALAWSNGYEVEKELLYEVLLPCVRWNEERSELVTEYQKLLFDKTSEETRFVHRQYVPVNNDYTCKLAESDIKEIDERFWLFAVLAND